MKKFRISVYVVITYLILLSASVLAQEHGKKSDEGGQNVTICHKGETFCK